LTGIDPGLADIMEKCWPRDPNIRPTFGDLVLMLHICRIDINLPEHLCAYSNEKWKAEFNEKRSYELKTIMSSLFGDSFEDGLKVKMLVTLLFGNEFSKYFILSTRGTKFTLNRIESEPFKKLTVLTPKKFSRLVRWLGPIDSVNPNNIFDSMKSLYENPWFFGSLGSDASQNLLRQISQKRHNYNIDADSVGHFIVRLNLGGIEKIEIAPFTIDSICFGYGETAQILSTRIYTYYEGDAQGYFVKQNGEFPEFRLLGNNLSYFISELQKQKLYCRLLQAPCDLGYPFEKFFERFDFDPDDPSSHNPYYNLFY